MTNQMIINNEKQRLASEGILKYTGRELHTTLDDGTVVTVKEVEDIHTFASWKAMGYSVKKGEKARCKFNIWTKGKDREKEVDGEVITVNGTMFMKTSYFFTADQVEKKEG